MFGLLMQTIILVIVFAIPIGAIVLFFALCLQNSLFMYFTIPGFVCSELFLGAKAKFQPSLLFLFFSVFLIHHCFFYVTLYGHF
jgi:hypothetical protein